MYVRIFLTGSDSATRAAMQLGNVVPTRRAYGWPEAEARKRAEAHVLGSYRSKVPR